MFIKNKWVAILLSVLIIANIATISMYWFGRKKQFPPLPQASKQIGQPSDFLIKELSLDSNQRAKYLELVKAHQAQTKDLREKTKDAKDHFFDLIKAPVFNDSLAKNDVSQISTLTAQQDMATLLHFRQVRALCNAPQQQKFDSIIHQMLGIMANQRPNMPPPKDKDFMKPPTLDEKRPARDDGRPPPDGRRPPPNGDRPPPPNGQPPPDRQEPPAGQ